MMEENHGFIMMLWMDTLSLIFHLVTDILSNLRAVTDLFIDVHLMITDPGQYFR